MTAIVSSIPNHTAIGQVLSNTQIQNSSKDSIADHTAAGKLLNNATDTYQKSNDKHIKRKKSKAPAIGAGIGAGLGAATGAYFLKSVDGFKNLKGLGPKAGIIGLCVASGALTYGIYGAVVSLFTRKSRQKAAVEESNAKLNVNA